MGDWGVIPRVFTLEVTGVITLGQGRVKPLCQSGVFTLCNRAAGKPMMGSDHAHLPDFLSAILSSISFWSSLVRSFPRDMASGDIPFAKIARFLVASSSVVPARFQ